MIWITIPIAPRYEVSDGGDVRVKSTKRVLKPFIDKLQDYPRVDLWDGHGNKVRMMVHILVAEAFFGKRPEGMEIDHINGIKSDNRVENLRYVSPQRNRANPITKTNMKVGNVRGLVAKGKITPEEGKEKICSIMEAYGNK